MKRTPFLFSDREWQVHAKAKILNSVFQQKTPNQRRLPTFSVGEPCQINSTELILNHSVGRSIKTFYLSRSSATQCKLSIRKITLMQHAENVCYFFTHINAYKDTCMTKTFSTGLKAHNFSTVTLLFTTFGVNMALSNYFKSTAMLFSSSQL